MQLLFYSGLNLECLSLNMLPQVSHQRFTLLPCFHMLRLHSLEKAIMGQYLFLCPKLLLEPCSDYRHPKLWLTILSCLYWIFLILGYTNCFNLLQVVCVPCVITCWTAEMIQSLKKENIQEKRAGIDIIQQIVLTSVVKRMMTCETSLFNV